MIKKILFLISILFFTYIFSLTGYAAEEILLGEEYQGVITETEEKREYYFSLEQSGKIDIFLTAGIKYIDLYIYDMDGNEVWKNTDAFWNSTIEVLNLDNKVDLTSGEYIFVVNRDSEIGEYTFHIDFISADESFQEKGSGTNNNFAQAQAIDLDIEYQGQIAQNDEKDFYNFLLTESGRISLSISSELKYMDLYIFDTDGNEIWKNQDLSWDTNTELLNYKEEIDLTTGNYYFLVNFDGYTGQYSFCMNYTASDESFPENADVGNSIEKAQKIDTGVDYKGQIAQNDEKDFYAFQGSGSVNFTVSGNMKYVDIYIFDSNGNEVWKNIDIFWDPNTEIFSLNENIEITDGTYTLLVQYDGYTGNYSFRLG